MPRYRHNPETGQSYMYDGGAGQWREMGALETELARSGAAGTVISAATGANPLLAITQPELAAAAQSTNPIATNLGAAATLLTGGGSIGQSARMADRIVNRSTTAKAPMKFTTESGMVKGLQEYVPESMRGTAQVVEAAFDAPGLRVLKDARTMQRRNVAGKALGRWLGMSDEQVAASGGKLTDEVMESMLGATDDMYAKGAGRISENLSPAQFNQIVDDVAERKLLIPEKAQAWKDMDIGTGEKLIALRSELRAMARQQQSLVDEQNIDQAILKIGDIVKDAVKGTDAEDVLTEADKRYARWMAIKNSQAIEAGTGIVRRAQLEGVLRREDPRMMLGKRGSLDKETADLVQAMKDWKSLGGDLPTSGTAERAAVMGALAGGFGVNIF